MSWVSKRGRILVLVTLVFILVAPLLGQLGSWAYLLFYPTGILVLVALTFRQGYKDSSVLAATAERSISRPSSFVEVCKVVPQVVSDCGWRLLEEDRTNGHFVAKIGISRKTWWQEVYIDAHEAASQETTLHLKCVAPHVISDRGQNNKMFDKFIRGLDSVNQR